MRAHPRTTSLGAPSGARSPRGWQPCPAWEEKTVRLGLSTASGRPSSPNPHSLESPLATRPSRRAAVQPPDTCGGSRAEVRERRCCQPGVRDPPPRAGSRAHLLRSRAPRAAMLRARDRKWAWPRQWAWPPWPRATPRGKSEAAILNRVFNHGPRHLGSLYGREGRNGGWDFGADGWIIVCILGGGDSLSGSCVL